MNRRWREVATAGHTGDSAALGEALGDADPVTRQLALSGLARTGRLTDDQVSAALTDADPGVRRRAAQLAAGRPAVDLLASLDDADPVVVEMAAWACGEREQVPEETLTKLIDLAVTADDPLVREASVAALGAIGDERGFEAVLHGTTDKPAIRRRATLALAAFDDERGIAALRAALDDRDWQVRQGAQDVLRAMGEDPPGDHRS